MIVRRLLFIIFSFVTAWALMILPIPENWQWLRPDWLALVIIFWVFALPRSVGVLTAWCAGFVMDILGGGLLGQYAFAMVIVAYFACIVRSRFRVFPMFQQVIMVLLLVGVGNLALLLVQWIIGNPPKSLLFFAPTITSLLCWPLLSRLLHLYEPKRIR